MRDLALLLMLLGLVWLALLRPWLGVLGLAVVGFMHPQGYGEGFMKSFPAYASLLAATGLGYLAVLVRQRQWPRLYWDWRLLGLLLLWGWFLVSTHFALAPFAAREKLLEMLKMLPPMALVWLLIDSRERLFYLTVTIALSIALVTVKGGYWAVMTGFHDRVYGPPGSQFAENNQFAVAVAMTIPLLVIWLREKQDRALRWAITGLIGLCYISALSTWSRGGVLSLAAMTVLLVWYSKRKYLAVPAVALGVVLVTAAFPEKWSGRMESILTFQDDASAQSRIEKWKIGWEAVLDRPVAGAGFEAWPILSGAKGGIGDWHSAYIEILAENGFVGLGIWGGILLGTIFGLAQLARWGWRRNEAWVRTYAGMLQASLLAYLAGGLTLGIAYWELTFWLIVSAGVLTRLAQDRLQARVGGPSESFTVGQR